MYDEFEPIEHKHELKQDNWRHGNSGTDWMYLIYKCRAQFTGAKCPHTLIILREGKGADVRYTVDTILSERASKRG